MSDFTVKVAFHPMYVEYIRSRWGDPNGRVKATNKNGHIGSVVKLQLRKQPLKPHLKSYPQEEHIEFVLPFYEDGLNVRYNNFISTNGEQMIRKWVRKQFYFDLHEHITNLNMMGFTEIKSSILNFCDYYDLDPLYYNYDSLKREYLRYRNKQAQLKMIKKATSFAAALSFTCPVLVPYL